MNEIIIGSFHDVTAVGAKGSTISILSDKIEYLINTGCKVTLRRGFGNFIKAEGCYPLIGLKLPPTRHISIDEEETTQPDDDFIVRTMTITGRDGFNIIWKLYSNKEKA